MATLEIWRDDRVTVFEEADGGGGISLYVREWFDEKSRQQVAGLFFGNRPVSDGWVPHFSNLKEGMSLTDAFKILEGLEGLTEVKLNGQTIWSAEAVKAVQEALGEED